MKKEKKKLTANQGTKTEIDPEKLEALAARFWSLEEMAAFFNCSTQTLTNRFKDLITKGRESGKSRLRDVQLKTAYGGNVTMLIWLGKQYLGQRDVEVNSQLNDAEIESLKNIAKTGMKTKM